MRLPAFVLLFMAGLAPAVSAQEALLPRIGTDDLNVQVWGWTWSTYDFETEEGDPLSMWRVRATVDTQTPFGAFVELDLTNGTELEDNLVRQAFVTYSPSGASWDIAAGRLFLAAYGTTPPPFLLGTARYMRYPFHVYGTGVQYHYADNGWDLKADVSGETNTLFDEGDQFDTLSASLRLRRDLSETLEVGVVLQTTANFDGIALETTWQPSPEHYVNAVAYTTDGDTERTGGYLFYGYRPIGDSLEFHAQLDYQEDVPAELLTTFGVRIKINRVQFVVDHELNEGATYARAQFRF